MLAPMKQQTITKMINDGNVKYIAVRHQVGNETTVKNIKSKTQLQENPEASQQIEVIDKRLYKLKLCPHLHKPCELGSSCQFAHSEDEQRSKGETFEKYIKR